MWNNINNRNYPLHIAESVRDVQEEQQQHSPQHVPQPTPQTTQPDNPAALRSRAHQHLAREEAEGRNRAEQAEARTSERHAGSPGTATDLPSYPQNKFPYPEDHVLTLRLVDGAKAGGSFTSTADTYKSKLIRFSAWLKQNKLPGMHARLFSADLTELAMRYSRECKVHDVLIALQHLRAMESSKFGTVHIEKAERFNCGKASEEDQWLINSAFTQKDRYNYAFKSVLRTFSAWLGEQNKSLCGCIEAKEVQKPVEEFARQHPSSGNAITTAMNHLLKFDSGEKIEFRQYRNTNDLPEKDKVLIEKFRDAEFERFQDKATRTGKTVKLHKQGKFAAPRRTSADKYATTLRSFAAWRQTQNDIKGSLASRLHSPSLDNDLDRWTKNMNKNFAIMAKFTVKRLRAVFPPGSYHAQPESPMSHYSSQSNASGSGMPGADSGGWGQDTQTSQPQHAISSPYRQHPPHQSMAAADNYALSHRGDSLVSQHSVLSRFPSLDSSTWRSLHDFDMTTPQSAFAQQTPQQHRMPAPQAGTPGSVFGGPPVRNLREFDLNTPSEEAARVEQHPPATPDSVFGSLASLDAGPYRSLREFDITTPQSAFRPPAAPANRAVTQQPATSDSVFEGLSSLGSLSNAEIYRSAPATPQSVRQPPPFAMTPGYASGRGLNCLLDSILQLYHGVIRSPGIETPQTQWVDREARRIRQQVLTPLGIAPHHGEIDIYGGTGQLLANSLGVRLQVTQLNDEGEMITHPPLGQAGPLLHLLHTPGHFQPLRA